jgi:hypothetical protein
MGTHLPDDRPKAAGRYGHKNHVDVFDDGFQIMRGFDLIMQVKSRHIDRILAGDVERLNLFGIPHPQLGAMTIMRNDIGYYSTETATSDNRNIFDRHVFDNSMFRPPL